MIDIKDLEYMLSGRSIQMLLEFDNNAGVEPSYDDSYLLEPTREMLYQCNYIDDVFENTLFLGCRLTKLGSEAVDILKQNGWSIIDGLAKKK